MKTKQPFGSVVHGTKAANEPTIRETCGWAEAQTLTKDSTAPLAMSKSVGRPPMYVRWHMDAEVSMRNTMIVMPQEWRGRATEFKNGRSDAYFEIETGADE